MTERFNQEPLITERDIYEGMSPNQLANLILAHGELVSSYERSMNLAAEVLEGAYGLTVEQVLQQREKENGTT